MTVTKNISETINTVSYEKSSLEWYISEVCDGMDLHTFVDSETARVFGLAVREQSEAIDVEINLKTVRLRLKS